VKKNNKWMLIGGGGLLIILLVIGGIILIRRRRRNPVMEKMPQVNQQKPVTANPVIAQPPQPSSTQSHPQQISPQSQPSIQPSPKFCVECGSPLKGGARFCVKCGKQL